MKEAANCIGDPPIGHDVVHEELHEAGEQPLVNVTIPEPLPDMEMA
jgi:hypothetical protein